MGIKFLIAFCVIDGVSAIYKHGNVKRIAGFDGVKGTEAVLKYATKNKYNHTAAEVQAVASSINNELGRFDPKRRHLIQIEVPNIMFSKYLYESLGIEI